MSSFYLAPNIADVISCRVKVNNTFISSGLQPLRVNRLSYYLKKYYMQVSHWENERVVTSEEALMKLKRACMFDKGQGEWTGE